MRIVVRYRGVKLMRIDSRTFNSTRTHQVLISVSLASVPYGPIWFPTLTSLLRTVCAVYEREIFPCLTGRIRLSVWFQLPWIIYSNRHSDLLPEFRAAPTLSSTTHFIQACGDETECNEDI
jgi:hypothetical protein